MKHLLVLFSLALSLNVLAIQNVDPGKGGGTVTGGGGGTSTGGGGGAGGSTGGIGSSGTAIVGPALLDPSLGGAPQYGINDVKPTSSGTCQVVGVGTGPWAGSPCEKIYGPTPITSSGSGGSGGTGSNPTGPASGTGSQNLNLYTN